MKMLKIIVIILIVIFGVQSAVVCSNPSANPTAANLRCNQHTEVYLKYKRGEISREMMFQSNTFLTGDTSGPHGVRFLRCKPYKSRREYISLLNERGIGCRSRCEGDKYSCKNNHTECWHVEHIYDQKNSPLVDSDVDIYGNLVMAYGKWNMQMGSKGWWVVQVEKSDVYGGRVFNQSRDNIIKCRRESNAFLRWRGWIIGWWIIGCVYIAMIGGYLYWRCGKKMN